MKQRLVGLILFFFQIFKFGELDFFLGNKGWIKAWWV